MTKLSDLGPFFPAKRLRAEPADERDHLYNCPSCGQLVDQRDPRQVFYHEGPRHEPLEPEPEGKVIEFRCRRD